MADKSIHDNKWQNLVAKELSTATTNKQINNLINK